ncbi:Rieske (2Fe-2S) protein [Cellulomonas fimi]|uniref:Cytochrome bc1 complex Rieske iron-sulfur subunit n=1 Tax=Cellulomonas fimi TaxID=1708 RepID=A0A7Y0LXR1_CELFI|nr:Rieske (2Fe-2S) protein [Cellulomonas fimi]NMR19990.1 Rieske (2Fe-2S) protein [Cellulomonas fimi]
MNDLDLQRAIDDRPPRTSAGDLGASAVTRRVVLRGMGTTAAGVGTVGVLAACGGGGTRGSGGSGGAPAPSPGAPLAKLDDIPVGGAISATAHDGTPIILAQPTAGTVAGLSAICTHQGCTVAPENSELACPCHGSRFALPDGAVLNGPAEEPLPPFAVKVENGEVLAG